MNPTAIGKQYGTLLAGLIEQQRDLILLAADRDDLPLNQFVRQIADLERAIVAVELLIAEGG